MKNILIIRVSAIGDVIHTFPAIILLKLINPTSRIHWIVQKKAAALLNNQPFIDHVEILPDHYLSFKNLPTTVKAIRKLQKIKWDAIIDFQGLLKTSLLYVWLSGKKYGFDAHNARSGWTSKLLHQPVSPDWINIIQKNLALTSAVAHDIFKSNASPSSLQLIKSCKLTFTPQQKTVVSNWLQEQSLNDIIIVAPNTTWLSKHWPSQHWKTLITRILHLHPRKPLVLVGANFGEQAKQLSLWAKTNKIKLFIAPGWDLLTTTYLIKKASLLIAPDTGLLHAADFIGTKTIALFGPTQKQKHGPFLQPLNQHYAQQASCAHNYKKTHDSQKDIDDPNNCMYKLAPDRVYDAMIEYLNLSYSNKLETKGSNDEKQPKQSIVL